MRNSLTLTPVFTAVAALGVALLSASSARAATYQVGPGKQYSSLKSVASLLAPGDVVEVEGNATYDGDIKFTKSGTASAKITIRGKRVGGKRPVLSGGTNTVHVYADHYVLEGLEITGGAARCVFHHGDDVTIRDSAVHDCPKHGILGADDESGSLTLEYVEVYHSGQGDTRHPIYMATDEHTHPGSVFRMEHCYVHDNNGGNNVKSRAERNEIYYNWIEGARYHEIELIGPDHSDEKLVREDSDVVGNVFRKTGKHYLARVGGDGTGQTYGRYRFVNNTFLLTPGSSAVFRLYDGIESIEMHNNVFYRSGGGGVQIMRDSDAVWSTGSAKIAGSNNWAPKGSEKIPTPWKNTILGVDPGFVDIGSFDVRPDAQSPLLNAGAKSLAGPPGFAFPKPLAVPTFEPPLHECEPSGQAYSRPKAGAIDIGAFEAGAPGQGGPTAGVSTGVGGAGGMDGASSSVSAGAGGVGGIGEPLPVGSCGEGGCAQHDPSPGEDSGCSTSTAQARAATSPAAMFASLALGMVFVSRRRRRDQ